ncbi:tRNA dihydrouridine synthase DusB [Gordonibacter sp. Marseille-P4307]|uniref:tRNA dihydrouridine synthase DusB n=1 Tax=Gordonibacter sp. Marseille-P4307 TaxID=2161815 RepID=UPI000F549796|nr:tRNA dihydrouridine synthase DusB [Gordonibacter sp. Marseille-P4307]
MGGFFESPRLLLAPMAGVSDEVFRFLAKEQGADLAYTEMVSAKGLSYASKKTRKLLELGDGEDRIAVQIFGHEPDTMAAQAAWVEDVLGEALVYLDINMGCPARKITGKGDGAALMNDPDLAARIVASVCAAIEHPVAVKFRRGYDEGVETCVDFARRMEDAGAASMVVHGRYARQMYRGRSDRGAIARVRQAVCVPVIANGDAVDAGSALDLVRETGCPSIMIARGAQGNPWVFSQVKAALEGRVVPGFPTVRERIDMARRHARLLAERTEGEIVRMRKHAMWYVAGIPGASAARARFTRCSTLSDFDAVLDDMIEQAALHDALDARCGHV